MSAPMTSALIRLYPKAWRQRYGAEMRELFKCAPAGVTMADQWRSAVWMIGGSLTLTAVGIWLKTQIGPNALSEGLVYAAFPASLMVSSECTYLKRYSARARVVMALGGAALVVLVTWGAVALANRI